MTNIHSINKEKTLLVTNKNFRSCDDEIFLKDLIPQNYKELNDEELNEISKTIEFSGEKLFNVFNLGKSIWTLAYDNIFVTLKNESSNLSCGYGYVYKLKELDNTVIVWEYKKDDGPIHVSRFSFVEIYSGPIGDENIESIINQCTSFEHVDDVPIFEAISEQEFPVNETLIPMIKRKINSRLNQDRRVDNN